MGEYMDVKELNENQREELKHDLFYGYRYNEDFRAQHEEVFTPEERAFLLNVNTCYWEIPDELVNKAFEGIAFVNDDFFCTCNVA